MEEWLKRLGSWFTNATMTAANADAPVVTTASGWLRDSNGNWNLNAINDPGVVLLRDNIADLSMLADGADIIPLVKAGYIALRHPVKTAKLVKKVVKPNLEYLQKYLRAVGLPRVKNTFKGNRSAKTKAFADYMESIGVDSSYFTENDLLELMKRREASVNYTKPSGKSAIIKESTQGSNYTPLVDIEVFDNGNYAGVLDSKLLVRNLLLYPLMVSKFPLYSGKGVSEAAYNGALTYANLVGLKGIRSGDELLSPEQTYRVWEKFLDKELIGNIGEHYFNNGKDVIKTGKRKVIENGPVYILKSPSYEIPTKHSEIFHPDIINELGRLNLPNWKDKDIYKSLVPLTLLSSYVYNSSNNGSNNK